MINALESRGGGSDHGRDPRASAHSRALNGRADTADDLVQDCLGRAIARFDQFRRGTKLRAWLFTIRHNVRCDQDRLAVRRDPEIPIDRMPEDPSTRPMQEDQMSEGDPGARRFPARPAGTAQRYAILERFPAIEATEPLPAEVHGGAPRRSEAWP
jgi:DNA-directed RNA polymerase specialized sigma24 family protein